MGCYSIVCVVLVLVLLGFAFDFVFRCFGILVCFVLLNWWVLLICVLCFLAWVLGFGAPDGVWV